MKVKKIKGKDDLPQANFFFGFFIFDAGFY
jgi:hypothetical protein